MKPIFLTTCLASLLGAAAGYLNTTAARRSLAAGPANDPLVVLYYENWALYPGRQWPPTYLEKYVFSRQMPMKNMVLNHAFVQINPETCLIEALETYPDFDITYSSFGPAGNWGESAAGIFGMYLRFKARYPNMKILPSVGGWSRSHGFS